MSMVVSANPKTTTKIDKRIRDQDPMHNSLNIKCCIISFFLFVKGVYQSADSVLMFIK